jgi:hypothetical protein
VAGEGEKFVLWKFSELEEKFLVHFPRAGRFHILILIIARFYSMVYAKAFSLVLCERFNCF